jgi:hypothetical protein
LRIAEETNASHVNIHVAADIRILKKNELPPYSRKKKQLIREFREMLESVEKGKITIENTYPIDALYPKISGYCEIGKITADLMAVGLPACFDTAHAAITYRTFLDAARQKTKKDMLSMKTDAGKFPIYWGKEEKKLGAKLLKRSKELKKTRVKEAEQLAITEATLHDLEKLKKKRLLKAVHLSNGLGYNFSYPDGGKADGRLKGELLFEKIIEKLRELNPSFVVTELKEKNDDYVNASNNTFLWNYLKKWK